MSEKTLEQAATAREVGVYLLQDGTTTRTSVTFVGDDGKIEHYESESTTHGDAKQAHRVAHALRDLAFKIDLRNRE